jgi:ribosomal-protein-serine acetyltransferase
LDAEILIRPYRPDDVEPLLEAAHESWRVVGQWLPWCHAGYERADAQRWVEEQAAAFASGELYEFAIVAADGGRLLGGCGLNAIRREQRVANLTYWVRTSERGRGVAPAAVRLLVAWARANTDLARLEMLVATDNAPSLKVARKVGAVEEGILPGRLEVLGVRWDAVVFSFTFERPTRA